MAMKFRLPVWGWGNGCVRGDPLTCYGSSTVLFLSPELQSWFTESNITYKLSMTKGMANLTIQDDNHAMLFKLTWL